MDMPLLTLHADENFSVLALDLFLVGMETSSNSTSFAVLYVVLYLEVQKKVQAEIDAVLGLDAMPVTSDQER
jgi:cytochrome P450